MDDGRLLVAGVLGVLAVAGAYSRRRRGSGAMFDADVTVHDQYTKRRTYDLLIEEIEADTIEQAQAGADQLARQQYDRNAYHYWDWEEQDPDEKLTFEVTEIRPVHRSLRFPGPVRP